MTKEKLLDIPEISYTLFHLPDNKCTPYVAAWCYDQQRDSWGQGHYFQKKLHALEYLVNLAKAKEVIS